MKFPKARFQGGTTATSDYRSQTNLRIADNPPYSGSISRVDDSLSQLPVPGVPRRELGAGILWCPTGRPISRWSRSTGRPVRPPGPSRAAVRHPCAVAALEGVVQQDGTVAATGGLHEGGHLARVQRVDAGIVVAGEEHDGGILGSRLHVLVGRVFEQVGELPLRPPRCRIPWSTSRPIQTSDSEACRGEDSRTRWRRTDRDAESWRRP